MTFKDGEILPKSGFLVPPDKMEDVVSVVVPLAEARAYISRTFLACVT